MASINEQIKKAKNINTLNKELKELAMSDNEKILMALASNKNITSDIVQVLLEKKINYVDQTLAENEHLEQGIYMLLTKHSKWYVRMALTENSAVSKEVLQIIIEEDEIEEIVNSAKEALKK